MIAEKRPSFDELIAELPRTMGFLARDRKGRPVPWFVDMRAPKIDGCPDFRIMDGKRLKVAIRERRCWVCGMPLRGEVGTFVSGPMCGINRTGSEPPNHLACARWSARGCPFLAYPKRVRDERAMPSDRQMAGVGILRNPGVVMLWTSDYRTYQPTMGGKGLLFAFGDPLAVEWLCEGRAATRDEVLVSIEGGLPTLVAEAQLQGREAVIELGQMTQAFIDNHIPRREP